LDKADNEDVHPRLYYKNKINMMERKRENILADNGITDKRTGVARVKKIKSVHTLTQGKITVFQQCL